MTEIMALAVIIIASPIAIILILRWARRSQAAYWGWDDESTEQ